MSKNIGIVCEGPTDYILLKGIVDGITGTECDNWEDVKKICISAAKFEERLKNINDASTNTTGR